MTYLHIKIYRHDAVLITLSGILPGGTKGQAMTKCLKQLINRHRLLYNATEKVVIFDITKLTFPREDYISWLWIDLWIAENRIFIAAPPEYRSYLMNLITDLYRIRRIVPLLRRIKLFQSLPAATNELLRINSLIEERNKAWSGVRNWGFVIR